MDVPKHGGLTGIGFARIKRLVDFTYSVVFY